MKPLRVDSTGASSFIAVTKSLYLYDSIDVVKVMDSGVYLSDHCPIIMDIAVTDRM